MEDSQWTTRFLVCEMRNTGWQLVVVQFRCAAQNDEEKPIQGIAEASPTPRVAGTLLRISPAQLRPE